MLAARFDWRKNHLPLMANKFRSGHAVRRHDSVVVEVASGFVRSKQSERGLLSLRVSKDTRLGKITALGSDAKRFLHLRHIALRPEALERNKTLNKNI